MYFHVDKWYCTTECDFMEGEQDKVLLHSKGFLWNGLQMLANRDIVREGNGPGIVSMWKIDMLKFWKVHPKYFIAGHQFLASK